MTQSSLQAMAYVLMIEVVILYWWENSLYIYLLWSRENGEFCFLICAGVSAWLWWDAARSYCSFDECRYAWLVWYRLVRGAGVSGKSGRSGWAELPGRTTKKTQLLQWRWSNYTINHEGCGIYTTGRKHPSEFNFLYFLRLSKYIQPLMCQLSEKQLKTCSLIGNRFHNHMCTRPMPLQQIANKILLSFAKLSSLEFFFLEGIHKFLHLTVCCSRLPKLSLNTI